ncbi:MAG TPA: YdcF family protein, partial [Spirochaetia bacterium]
MIVISGIFTALFLTPVLFIALIVAAALVGRSRRRAVATWLLAVAAGMLFVASLPVVKDVLLRPLERAYPAIARDVTGIGAVVVLGSGVENGSPDEGGDPSLTQTAFKRVVYGSLVARSLDVPVVVSGGTTWQNRGTKSEAAVAQTLLVRLGMPAERVVMEERSRTTWENARNTASILRERGVGRVALVTSAIHMPRAMLAFTRAGVLCVAAPTDY